MDCIELIRVARLKGLSLEVVDGVLKVRGPKKFTGVVAQLIANKAEVIAALAMPHAAAASQFDRQISGDSDETIGTPVLTRVSSPTNLPIGVLTGSNCGPLHVQPGQWEHREGRATCPSCGKFMGYVRTNGGQDGREA